MERTQQPVLNHQGVLPVYHGAVKAHRWILRALVALVLLIPILTLTPATAHAEGPGLIDVTITANSAPVLDLSNPEQVVELSGIIINTSTARVQFTAVDFWRSATPITSETQLGVALASPAAEPIGERPPPFTVESGHAQRIQEDDWFSPGDRASFQVRATVEELGLRTNEAAYLVGVHVRGIVEDTKGRQTVGRGRILVAATSSPLASSQVVELAAGPQRTPDGDFTGDSLTAALTSDLDELLAVAEDSDTTVLLDPMLLMDVRALAEDHTVDGVPQPPVEQAAEWASRMDAVIRDGHVFRLPWSNIDLPRARAVGHLEDAVGWADDALTDPELRALPLAADLGASANSEVARELSQLGFSMALARNTSGGSIGSLRVVRLSEPDAEGMGPGGSNTSVQQLGRRVAAEVVSKDPPTYLARTSEEARIIATLGAQRTVSPIVGDDGPTTFAPTQDAPRWDELASSIESLIADAAFRQDLTGNDDLPQVERVAAVAMSSGFTTEEAALDWLSSGSVAVADPEKITISAAGEFVMASRSNTFPVTITNDLDVPVTLRMVFDSDSPQRIRVPATEFVEIEAGENRVVTINPEASSNSVVNIEGSMETRGGERFGAAVNIEITATQLGRVGWIIIIVSGAVVLGGTVWRIRAVQSERSEGDT